MLYYLKYLGKWLIFSNLFVAKQLVARVSDH